jgi:hypothetical protein
MWSKNPVMAASRLSAVTTPKSVPLTTAVPFRRITQAGVLAFFSTTTVFGTPVDITLSELAVEAFFPADQQTAETLRRLAG